MSELETLTFTVILNSEYTRRPPEFEILLDNTLFKNGIVDKETSLTFDVKLDEDRDYSLKIRLKNKNTDTTDTVVDDEGNITEDQHLILKGVKINDFDLDSLIWKKGKYTLDTPYEHNGEIISEITGETCCYWSWNGVYEFNFKSPFYLWLLENL